MSEADGRHEDPYSVLGIGAAADDAAVRAAYRAALRQHPPESDPEGFKRVRGAYEALRDVRQRVRTLLFHGWLLPALAEVTPEQAGARPLPCPDLTEMLVDLRQMALAGTDLTRSDFADDLRLPAN